MGWVGGFGVEVHSLVFLNMFPNITAIPGLKITSKVIIAPLKIEKRVIISHKLLSCVHLVLKTLTVRLVSDVNND